MNLIMTPLQVRAIERKLKAKRRAINELKKATADLRKQLVIL